MTKGMKTKCSAGLRKSPLLGFVYVFSARPKSTGLGGFLYFFRYILNLWSFLEATSSATQFSS